MPSTAQLNEALGGGDSGTEDDVDQSRIRGAMDDAPRGYGDETWAET